MSRRSYSVSVLLVAALWAGCDKREPVSPSAPLQTVVSSTFVQGLCGQTIAESVTLTQDIGPCSTDGIIIGADGITLDGDGHVLSGNGSGIGVSSAFRDVTISHLFVEGFQTGIGIFSGEGTVVIENQIRENGIGVEIQSNDGAPSGDNRLELNVIADNVLGLYLGWAGNSIYHNILWNNNTHINAVAGNVWTDEGENLGNVWSDYWGNDLTGDGVGDTDLPHQGVDHSPLIDPTLAQRFGNGGFLCDDWWTVSYLSIIWRGGWSPVEIEITDPYGRRLSSSVNEMRRIGFYAEDDAVQPGTKRVQAFIMTCTKHDLGNGTYSLKMKALDNLTYDMEWFANRQGTSYFRRSVTEVPLSAGEMRSVDTDLQQAIDPNTGDFLGAVVTDVSAPRLIVTKSITGGGAQSFDFTRNPGNVPFSLTDGGLHSSGFSLAPGTHRVCENNLAVSWSATATTDGSLASLINPDVPQDLGNRCVDVALPYGDSRTLAWTNRPPPSGDARTSGYWKNWSSCSGGNQYTQALKRGVWDGTLDGNLPQTAGILTLAGAPGPNLTSPDCLKAVRLLDKSDVVSGKKLASDGAYNLVAQLLAAMLNVHAGASQRCSILTTIGTGQALLFGISFSGTGAYQKTMTPAAITQAGMLASALDRYNNNTCIP